uniref:Peptidylprolyl isomerase n=1 Tax=Chromera velia CCMP2878 TaxID=1169474 RepID=A0A0G4HZ94_9ALVE|eukprot:Cvel_33896.t1-p1 / transcript=Cvel_33896.t1 / gene=Cvel_33896 / organism=Chromera_velia_CCMP2878 / gene_product=Peptidyl-prolyl cis-trans isomerase FKBP19,, putative / transcript_product=Peptidyl-prolyl cis-trans isomerase FKBP19,, putative / location=Cvel_scaffold5647:170-3005(-) / protein_length=229 / sequence_SO=supercontig / SO=protein_coding / is_pseudo=false
MGYSRRDGRDGLASSQGRLFSRSALLLLFLLGVQRSHSFSISSTFSELPSFRLGERTERRPLPASILYSIDDVSEVETEGKGKIVSRRSLTNTSPVWLLAGLAAATSGFAKPSLAAQDLSVYGSETKRDALGKARTRYEDFKMLPSGAQVKDVKTGQQGEKPQAGDRVVIDWEGYTIGYYGRIFEKKQGTIKGGAFYNDDSAAQPYFRFVVSRPIGQSVSVCMVDRSIR